MPAQIGNALFPKKPPKYWLEAKRRDGLSDAAAGRIWWRNYTDAKRYTAWLAAPADEWEAHGLTRPRM